MKSGWAIWTALAVLTATVLAGCSGGPAPAPASAATAKTLESQGHASAQAGQLLPLPRGVAATSISGGSEPLVVASHDGKMVWIGDSTGGYYSSDNGTTWAHMPDLNFNLAFIDGWALAEDGSGALYAADLNDNHVDVGRSINGGQSWASITDFAGVSGTADRPWLAAQGDGEVVLFYFDAPAVVTGVYEHCARSTDKGATWLDRDPMAGPPQGGSAFFDASGHFYYSQDSGVLYKFGGTCLGGASGSTMVAGADVNNMISAASDGDRVYMAAATNIGTHVVLAGTAPGASLKTLVLNPPSLQSNTYAAVAARNGLVAVTWLGSTTPGDPRLSSYGGTFGVYLALVQDFWGTPKVTVMQLAAGTHHGWICMNGISCTSGRSLADYMGVAIDKWGGTHAVFVNDTGSPGVFYVHVPPPGAVAGPGPGAPTAFLTLSVDGLTVSADASTSAAAAGMSLTAFSWDWGDNGATGSGVTATHTYGATGTYRVELTVTQSDGQRGSSATLVSPDGGTSAPPTADFDFTPANPGVGQLVTFDASAQAQGTAAIQATQWDFGDGTGGQGGQIQHSYGESGNYTVHLSVTDDRGATGVTTKVVHVQDAAGSPSRTPTTADSSPASRRAAAPSLVAALGSLAVAAAFRRPWQRRLKP
jgi:PKD repeat protein